MAGMLLLLLRRRGARVSPWIARGVRCGEAGYWSCCTVGGTIRRVAHVPKHFSSTPRRLPVAAIVISTPAVILPPTIRPALIVAVGLARIGHVIWLARRHCSLLIVLSRLLRDRIGCRGSLIARVLRWTL